MGVIIKARELAVLEQGGLQSPIVFVNPEKELAENAIPLNVELAKNLSMIKPNRRTMRMEQCFRQVLESLPDDPIIMDFDVLFNPTYEIDVMKILSSVAKTKPFRAIWPGKYENGKLIYAEEGYSDYKIYEISKYDITCVI